MSTLAEIEAATEALPPEQLQELLRFVGARLRTVNEQTAKTTVAPVWHPPAPKAMGKFLAPETEWTNLCHR